MNFAFHIVIYRLDKILQHWQNNRLFFYLRLGKRRLIIKYQSREKSIIVRFENKIMYISKYTNIF